MTLNQPPNEKKRKYVDAFGKPVEEKYKPKTPLRNSHKNTPEGAQPITAWVEGFIMSRL